VGRWQGLRRAGRLRWNFGSAVEFLFLLPPPLTGSLNALPQVPESEVLSGHSPTLEAIMRRWHSPEEVALMQSHLAAARHALLYGAGDPFATPQSPVPLVGQLAGHTGGGGAATAAAGGGGSAGGGERFSSRLVEHVLQQAFELGALPPATRYRRFKPAFAKCLDLTLSTS